MTKQELRECVWDALEDSGEARFPFPPHGRIPNFAGADEAADRLADQEVWATADTVKANPDAPQLPVRRAAVRAGKTLYMAVPRLAEEQPFLRLDPEEIDDIDEATTVGGSAEAGVPVDPAEMPPIDLIVTGCVAVTPEGARVGKGEGYSDLEFAVLRETGLVDDDTPTATTVHPIQVIKEAPTGEHDVPMDTVVTPGETVRDGRREKPSGIDWDAVTAEQREEIPVLRQLHDDAEPGGV